MGITKTGLGFKPDKVSCYKIIRVQKVTVRCQLLDKNLKSVLKQKKNSMPIIDTWFKDEFSLLKDCPANWDKDYIKMLRSGNYPPAPGYVKDFNKLMVFENKSNKQIRMSLYK